MASIKSNYKTDLALPDGTVLAAGQTTDVPHWDQFKDNAVIVAWQKAGILKVDAKASDADEKAELQGKLDALQVDYNKRAGVAKLRDLLAEAEAAAAAKAAADAANDGDKGDKA